MFTGLTEEICRKAWLIVLPSVRRATQAHITNKEAGTIVVLNPHDGEVLFIARVDDSYDDAGKYDVIARAKAVVCWETGLTSRRVQQSSPHLYKPGMTKWGGGVVEDRLVVAFSGVQAVFDEAIAWSMLNWIMALCRHEMTREGGVMESDSSYIEDPLESEDPWESIPGGQHFGVG